MIFINRYNKTNNSNYHYSNSFKEGTQSFVLAAGQVGSTGLITRINADNGNKVWEKSYNFSGGSTRTDIVVQKIIKTVTQKDPGVFSSAYIGHMTDGSNHYIFGLNISTGAILWNKKITLSDDVMVQIEPAKAAYGFYLSISASASSKESISPFVGFYNTSGVLQTSKVFGLSDAIVTAFNSHHEGLVLSTRNFKSGAVSVISLSHSLTVVESFNISSPAITINSISASSSLSYHLTASYSSQPGGICVLTYYSPVMDGQGWKLFDFPKRGIKTSVIRKFQHFDYILEYDAQESFFHLLDGINIEWTKKIDFANGIINDFNISAEAVAIDFSIQSNPGSTVTHTDLNLSSCKTQEINSGILVEKTILTSVLAIRIGSSSYALTNVSLVASDVVSTKEEICQSGGTSIDTSGENSLQSGNFYLQAAGSTGNDSTSGIYLRWLFKDALTEHLPKGNYYQGNPIGFNRSNDFVKLYRAPYNPITVTLQLTTIPTAVVDNQALWLYELGNKKFYVYFRNTTRYQQIRNSVNPLVNPSGFLSQYGNNLIEIENQDSLFFASRMIVSNSNGNVKTEICSVETNKLNLPKHITFRKNLNSADFGNKIYSENARSIRYAAFNCYVTQLIFEFYDDFLSMSNNLNLWTSMGQFGLSTNDTEVVQRLNPSALSHPIHAKWLRYNDRQYVNINNYIKKWNGVLDDPRNRIKESVEQYMALSNDPNNPLANETYYLNDSEDQTDNSLEISHLALLQMASLDFHVARMLGLGSLDFNSQIYSGGKFIYAAQYITEGDIGDGNGAREIKHLSLSLPTSMQDERLSLPVELKEPVPGIFSSETEIGNGQVITDEDGYSHDGRSRFLSLFVNELTPDEPADSAFYFSGHEFDMSKFTYPVYAGIEYRAESDVNWRIPELPNDREYQNVDSQGNIAGNETVAIAIPDVGQPVFLHRETHSGIHIYGSYGVNWFSRATRSDVVWEIETDIEPFNHLLPPSSGNALLIQQEAPLMFTSDNEQTLLSNISDDDDDDDTLIRLMFNYDCSQDMISYHKAINGEVLQDFEPLPDNEEIFADEVEIFFRPKLPTQLFGVVKTIADLPDNPLVGIIETNPLELNSEGNNEFSYPTIAEADIPNYIGGIFKVGADEYIIHHIEIPISTPLLPIFHILKKQVGDAFGEPGNSYDPSDFIIPEAGQTFMVMENMLNTASWGAVNPHPLKVQIGDQWSIHSEEVTVVSGEGDDTQDNTYFRRFRGIVSNTATVKKYTDDFIPVFDGLYEITFSGFSLTKHPQDITDFPQNANEVDFVQWYGGSIRIPYEGLPNAERKTLKVLRIDNSGASLKVYALDENYQSEPLQSVNERNSWVHFYPGYRVYLYKNEPYRLTEENILPQEENVFEKYSIFGLRSRVMGSADYISSISTTMMFARKIESPDVPEQPKGALYATRPDYFGKSTYTFTTQYSHKPFSVNFLRSNSDILLSSMFKQTPYGQEPIFDSVEDILIKNDDQYFNNRLIDLANAEIDSNFLFPQYNGYRFPLPNNHKFFESINRFIVEHNEFFSDNVPLLDPNNISDMDYVVIPAVPNRNDKLTFYSFVKQAIESTFVPLTEIPVIYQYIKGGDYRPIPKSQVIRDRNGSFLNPTDAGFDMAPMIKILSTNPHKTLFTDFTLDGASTGLYFYAVKETNVQMQASNFSPVIGPVKLVNSYALKTPEIRSVIPILENPVLEITPAMRLEVNSYAPLYKVKRINLYRALNMGDATDVRSMSLVKSIDLETEDMLTDTTWTIEDSFSDLQEVPFSDPLYYRITVESKIEYAEANYDYSDDNIDNEFIIVSDYAPSEASKLMVTTITENVLPTSPILSYSGDTLNGNTLSNVKIKWSKQAYRGKYHLYKMNSQGNWVKLITIQSNELEIEVALADTNLDSDQLIIENNEGDSIFHHFKVITENTAGMLSIEEIILTIPNT